MYNLKPVYSTKIEPNIYKISSDCVLKKVSLGKAAEIAGVSIREMLDILNEKDISLHISKKSLVIATAIGDRRNEGIWLGNLGNVCSDFGEVDKAIEYYQKSL